jgi:hypothetical protein
VKARHRLSNEDWLAMGESDELVRLVEAAKLRRIRTGATKRELAQIEIVAGPPILGKIMRDPGSNARHVIDAVKTLDTLAANGAEAAAAGARFEITINLGADHIERYSKSIEINADDVDPHHTDARIAGDTDDIDSRGLLAAFAAKKSTDDGNGDGHL